MRYALHDRVVQGLLALDDTTLRRVHAIIEWIAAQTVQAAQAGGFDDDGRPVYRHRVFGFYLHYFIARDGRVIFTDLYRHSEPPN